MKSRDKIIADRYLQEGETEDDMYRRVAKFLANTDQELEDYYKVMSEMLFLPNTPTLVNAGSNREGGFSACYVLPVEDNIDGIYKTLKDMALIHKAFGGTGFNFSNLRPKGDLIKSTGGKATGPVGFIKLFDANSGAIKQGGHREGGNMGILNVSHPDIENFVEAEFDHFNLSVGISNEFMHAVVNGLEWPLAFGSKIYKYVDAKTLFRYICKSAWKSGNPGLVFLDRIQKDNPIKGTVLDTTNPCIVGDTLITTVEGDIPIKDLVGMDIDVYCIGDDYKLTISTARNIRMTKNNTSLVKVDTTKGIVICTPDHKFYTRNRGYIEASKLVQSDKVVALNKAPKNQRYSKVYLTGNSADGVIAEHRFVAQHYYGNLDGKNVHHIDNNPLNNSFSNLGVMTHGEHSKLTNNGHINWCNQDSETGMFVSKIDKKEKEWNNALGVHPIGVNMKLIEVIPLSYTEDVYDMEVDQYHNYIANHVVIHNCGEQPLLPYESCNLGSVNLAKMTNVDVRGTPIVDWMLLGDTVRIAIDMLDTIISVNQYPLDEVREKTLDTRKIGLGVMGWHDMLIYMNLAYDSQEALTLAEEVMGFITDHATEYSNQMGNEINVFPMWGNSTWYDQDKPMRNAALTTIAPTGTLSIIAECSSGIEPVYEWEYVRKVEAGTFVEKHPTKDLAEVNELMDTAHDIDWRAHVRMQAVFQKHVHNAVSKTINMKKSCTVGDVMSAYLMAFDTQCKGITIYRDGSREEQVLSSIDSNLDDHDGWKSVGLKPDNMKNDPPVINTNHNVLTGFQGEVVHERGMDEEFCKVVHPRPKRVSGSTEHCVSGCGTMFVTTNEVNGKPYEVFVQHSDGGCHSNMEAIGKLISLLLKEGVNKQVIYNRLKKIKCANAIKSDKSEGHSCAQIIGNQLMGGGEISGVSSFMNDYTTPPIDNDNTIPVHVDLVGCIITHPDNICPECGEKLNFGEGCGKGTCRGCGWSGCN